MNGLFLLGSGFTGQVADGAGNDGNLMPLLCQHARQLMMTGSPGFVNGSKSLMDEQNMHIPILLCSGFFL